MIRAGMALRYLVLTTGVAGMTYYAYNKYGPSSASPDTFRFVFAGLLSSSLGYLGVKYLRIAHCESPLTPKKDDDIVDEALRGLHAKVEEVKGDIKEKVDQKAEEVWKDFKDKYITPAMEESFEFIKEIFDNLRDFSELDTINFESPLPVILALIKRAQDRNEEDWLQKLPQETQIGEDKFLLHRRIAEYALAIYEASGAADDAKQAAELGLEDSSDLLFARFEDKDGDDHCAKFCLIADHEHKAIVLAIRGTFCLTDVIIDVICDEEEFLHGFAHRGILRGAKKLLSEVELPLQDALKIYPEYRLFVTGHSLGAGTALLVTMDLLDRLNTKKTKLTVQDVHCVALAPPPVFRSNEPLPASVRDSMDIYINSQDCVPRMSLASVAKLLAIARAVDALNMTAMEQMKVMLNYPDKETMKNTYAVQQCLETVNQDRFPFLEHPGTIHYLYDPTYYKLKDQAAEGAPVQLRGVRVVRESSMSFSRKLLLLERMVLDHLQYYYRLSLEDAQQTIEKLKEKAESE